MYIRTCLLKARWKIKGQSDAVTHVSQLRHFTAGSAFHRKVDRSGDCDVNRTLLHERCPTAPSINTPLQLEKPLCLETSGVTYVHTTYTHIRTPQRHSNVSLPKHMCTTQASDRTFVRVMRRPLMEVTTMIPTRRKDTYWAQNSTYREMEAGLSKMWRYVYCNDG